MFSFSDVKNVPRKAWKRGWVGGTEKVSIKTVESGTVELKIENKTLKQGLEAYRF